jgi:hypothetical protein
MAGKLPRRNAPAGVHGSHLPCLWRKRSDALRFAAQLLIRF